MRVASAHRRSMRMLLHEHARVDAELGSRADTGLAVSLGSGGGGGPRCEPRYEPGTALLLPTHRADAASTCACSCVALGRARRSSASLYRTSTLSQPWKSCSLARRPDCGSGRRRRDSASSWKPHEAERSGGHSVAEGAEGSRGIRAMRASVCQHKHVRLPFLVVKRRSAVCAAPPTSRACFFEILLRCIRDICG